MKTAPTTNLAAQATREALIWQYYLALASRPQTIYVESYDAAVSAVAHYQEQTKIAREKA